MGERWRKKSTEWCTYLYNQNKEEGLSGRYLEIHTRGAK